MLAHPLLAVTASALLEKFHKVWGVFTGIFEHSCISRLSGSDAKPGTKHQPYIQQVGSSVQVTQVLPTKFQGMVQNTL